MDKAKYLIEMVTKEKDIEELGTNDFNFLDCGWLALEGNKGVTRFVNLDRIEMIHVTDLEELK